MRIQGWGIPVAVVACTEYPAPVVCGESGMKCIPKAVETAAKPPPHGESGRSELLASIKQRIKSGFYNSESVIDDLGHGFARALDPTL